tara:strand:+ start:272 stop:436 length:165 start_codon:yes stop_codon:yes gene_type:complete
MSFKKNMSAAELYASTTRNLSIAQIIAVQQGDERVIGASPVMRAARKAYVAMQK